jgi:copper transport protein
VAGLTLLLCAAPAAHAHAVLVSSDPVDGARLGSAPAVVTLTFDEPVRLVPDAVQVISSSDGTRVSTGAMLRDGGTTVVLPLRGGLAHGSYTANWRVISADTHEVTGSISFGVGQDVQAPTTIYCGGLAGAGWAFAAARISLCAGLVLAVGVAFGAAVLWPAVGLVPRVRSSVRAGCAVVAAASVGEFAIATARDSGRGWGEAANAAALADTATTKAGLLIAARIVLAVALSLLTTGLFRTNSTRHERVWWIWRLCGAALAVVMAMTVAADGHAGAGRYSAVATLATTAHIVAMSVWIGGLALSWAVVLPADPEADLDHWSAVAGTSVVVIVASGVFQAWRQVAPPESLWSTGYGLTLCAKVAVVTAMLGLAYRARRRLGRGPLRRTVAIEATLGGIVIALTTVLVSQAPARTTYGPPVSATALLDRDRTAQVDISTTRRGPIEFDMSVVGSHGEALRAHSVSGTLSSHDAGIAALNVKFVVDARGHWRSASATVPRPGHWSLRLTVEFSPSDAVVTTVPFRAW